ncbi:type II RES/Xre toxin-antitoxin system antitoxin [Siccirubricoccus phaeus]|uniref:type II RES/Xre toxin-antitoxin system antitoxin n=1 Tax=Siccirubricoccus phaeus TaxID=2595053 RepID=UPI0011F25228|nr:antitoxin Xre/MbcA/ParS toxin-binding domain-containing protein [Siccirubricoccus phaeus]
MSAALADTPALSQAAALLGGRRALRRELDSRLAAHDLLRDGLPGHALEHLVSHVALLAGEGLEAALGISLRTYQRRREEPARRLSPEQSGRIWTFAELLARATTLLGSQQAAEAWFLTPALALEGRRPLDLLSTPAGVEALAEHLTRLEFGVYT